MQRAGLLQIEAWPLEFPHRESALLVFELFDLLRASSIESAGADELHGTLKFEFVKPRAMRLANVDDDMRALGELNPVHQFVANRARYIANGLLKFQGLIKGSRHACCKCLLFAVRGNLLQGIHVHPNPFAATTFEQIGRADGHIV